MIASFGDAATEDLYHGVKSARVRRFPNDVIKSALRKLDMIQAAHDLDDLRALPGNRLKELTGDWKGYHGLRVNDQWRIVFRWRDGRAHDVTLLDYH
jgi:proteic killer suppression protein